MCLCECVGGGGGGGGHTTEKLEPWGRMCVWGWEGVIPILQTQANKNLADVHMGEAAGYTKKSLDLK